MKNAVELLQYMTYPAVLEHLAEDVEWTLPVSLWDGVGGTHTGRPAVEAMLAKVMTEFYDPEKMTPEIIVAHGTDEHATMVFTMNAITRWGQEYRNRYSITIEAAGGKITKVLELLDTKNLFDTMDNSKLG